MPGQLLAGTGQTCPDFSTTAMNATQRWQWCGWPSLTSLLQQQAVATAHPSSTAPTYCTQGLHTCNHTECVRLHPHVATQGAQVHVQLCVCVGVGGKGGGCPVGGPCTALPRWPHITMCPPCNMHHAPDRSCMPRGCAPSRMPKGRSTMQHDMLHVSTPTPGKMAAPLRCDAPHLAPITSPE